MPPFPITRVSLLKSGLWRRKKKIQRADKRHFCYQGTVPKGLKLFAFCLQPVRQILEHSTDYGALHTHLVFINLNNFMFKYNIIWCTLTYPVFILYLSSKIKYLHGTHSPCIRIIF
uniref:Uncharacterized protein n=1 Tax=Cacopsylla melanoneura TaxID=428564 RepID=A0A8D8ZG53_9HEMI